MMIAQQSAGNQRNPARVRLKNDEIVTLSHSWLNFDSSDAWSLPALFLAFYSPLCPFVDFVVKGFIYLRGNVTFVNPIYYS